MKPLFIPLKTEYYEAFKSGAKTEELRLFGKRWNNETCKIGREVILSKGYGKHDRMKGIIWQFACQHGTAFNDRDTESIKAIYGELNIYIARIFIKDLKPITA